MDVNNNNIDDTDIITGDINRDCNCTLDCTYVQRKLSGQKQFNLKKKKKKKKSE